MAGNGFEWTCSVADDENKTVPFGDTNWNDRVSLRGISYFATAPYRFSNRPEKRYRFKNPQDEPGASAEVGFRVVVPVLAAP